MRIVGPKPSASTSVRIATAQNGSDVSHHSGSDDIALTKNAQSIRVIDTSARLAKARTATPIVITPETPIGQAPAPPSSAICARKTMKVVAPQITQEKTWGLVCPERIERT